MAAAAVARARAPTHPLVADEVFLIEHDGEGRLSFADENPSVFAAVMAGQYGQAVEILSDTSLSALLDPQHTASMWFGELSLFDPENVTVMNCTTRAAAAMKPETAAIQFMVGLSGAWAIALAGSPALPPPPREDEIRAAFERAVELDPERALYREVLSAFNASQEAADGG